MILALDRRRVRQLLLASTAAMLVGASQAASAGGGGAISPVGWRYTIEGDYVMWSPNTDLAWGTQDEARTDGLRSRGWGGAFSVGWHPEDMGPWDFVLGGRFEQSNRKSVSGTWSGDDFPTNDGGDANFRERHIAVDFEVGREIGIGNWGMQGADLRVHGGVRFAQFNSQTNFRTHEAEIETTPTGTESCVPTTPCLAVGKIERRFSGAGPRFGWNFSTPIGDGGGGPFGIDFNGAAAALFGERVTEWRFSTFESVKEKPNLDSAKFTIVPDVEASLALTWRLSPNSKLALGYRVDAAWNTTDFGWPGSEDFSGDSNRVTHGAFISWTQHLN